MYVWLSVHTKSNLSTFLSILMQLVCWKCFINTGFFWLKQMKLNSSWEVHHTFHNFSLKGSQIASWFPSFSVEVMHTRVNNLMEGQLPESRIEAMVRIERSSKLSGSKSEVFLALRVLLSRPFLFVCLFCLNLFLLLAESHMSYMNWTLTLSFLFISMGGSANSKEGTERLESKFI